MLCIGITNVGEVVLAREVLRLGGSGLAPMVAAGGLGTVLGSLRARFTTAGTWAWRQAYLIGLVAMAAELIACAVLRSFWLVVPALAIGGFGNGPPSSTTACCSPSAPRVPARPPLRPAEDLPSLAFAVSFVGGALIAIGGVQPAFLVSGSASAGRRRRSPAQGLARPTPRPTPPRPRDALA